MHPRPNSTDRLPLSRHVPLFRSTLVAARGNQARHSFGNFRPGTSRDCPLHSARMSWAVSTSNRASLDTVDIVEGCEECQCYFNFDSVSDIIAKRTHKFLTSFGNSDSLLCSVRHAWI